MYKVKTLDDYILIPVPNHKIFLFDKTHKVMRGSVMTGITGLVGLKPKFSTKEPPFQLHNL